MRKALVIALFITSCSMKNVGTVISRENMVLTSSSFSPGHVVPELLPPPNTGETGFIEGPGGAGTNSDSGLIAGPSTGTTSGTTGTSGATSASSGTSSSGATAAGSNSSSTSGTSTATSSNTSGTSGTSSTSTSTPTGSAGSVFTGSDSGSIANGGLVPAGDGGTISGGTSSSTSSGTTGTTGTTSGNTGTVSSGGSSSGGSTSTATGSVSGSSSGTVIASNSGTSTGTTSGSATSSDGGVIGSGPGGTGGDTGTIGGGGTSSGSGTSGSGASSSGTSGSGSSGTSGSSGSGGTSSGTTAGTSGGSSGSTGSSGSDGGVIGSGGSGTTGDGGSTGSTGSGSSGGSSTGSSGTTGTSGTSGGTVSGTASGSTGAGSSGGTVGSNGNDFGHIGGGSSGSNGDGGTVGGGASGSGGINLGYELRRVCSFWRSKIAYPDFIFFEEAKNPRLTSELFHNVVKGKNKKRMPTGIVLASQDLKGVSLMASRYQTTLLLNIADVKAKNPNQYKNYYVKTFVCEDSNHNGLCSDEKGVRVLSVSEPSFSLDRVPQKLTLDVWNGRTRTLAADPGFCEKQISPLVLDLSGNGFRATDAASGVYFDLNATGEYVNTAWMEGKDDAFLVIDRNGNGIIDDGGELFGNATLLKTGYRAANGFEALKEFDSNADGFITVKDARYQSLRLWLDRNRDGLTDRGEMMTLDRGGVVSISLDYKNISEVDALGNETRQRSIFKRQVEGREYTLQIIDIWFSTLVAE